jgi:hypothetical protein
MHFSNISRRFQELPPFQRSTLPPSPLSHLQLVFRCESIHLSFSVSTFVESVLRLALRQTKDATALLIFVCSSVSSGSAEGTRGLSPP